MLAVDAIVQLASKLALPLLYCLCGLCFPGSRKLFGGLRVCPDRRPRVHGERRRQISHRALRRQGDGQRQQEDHLPDSGPRQRCIEAGEGDYLFEHECITILKDLTSIEKTV